MVWAERILFVLAIAAGAYTLALMIYPEAIYVEGLIVAVLP